MIEARFSLTRRLLHFGIAACLGFGALAQASPVFGAATNWSINLDDLGQKGPLRIMGPVNEQDFFFPLPVRQFDPATTNLSLGLRASVRIATECTVEIFANDVLVGQRLINPGEVIRLDVGLAPIRPETLEGDFLKITVRIALRRANATEFDRCEDLITRELWVEVLESSMLTTIFDDQNPDWLSVSRLPVTMQRRLDFDLAQTSTAVQRDLALKALSWAFYVTKRPHALNEEGQLLLSPGGVDRFLVLPSSNETDAGIRVEATGLDRTIRLQAATLEQSLEIWRVLKELSQSRMPGARYTLLEAPGTFPAMEHRESYRIVQLEPTFTEFAAGIGDITREFGFDTALFGPGDMDLQLKVEGRHSPVIRSGSALMFVYLNDRLIHTQELKVDSNVIDLDILLRRDQLQEENLVRFTVAYFPTEGECKNPLFYFGYQLHDSSTISLVNEGAAYGKIFDLVRMARRFFGRERFYVAVPGSSSLDVWKTAAYAVAWIQRLNTRRLIQPEYFEGALPPSDSPSLIFSMDEALERDLTGWRILPLVRQNGEFKLESLSGEQIYALENSATVGFLQAAYNRNGKPVMFADSWGSNGDASLLRVVRQMASLPWMGQGDLVIGDGLTPSYSFETRDLVISSGDTTIVPRGQEWKSARFWVLIPVWIAVSVLMIWILKQAVQRAKS